MESGEIPLSSEATFRFCFTWELGRILGFAPEFKFDFERELYTSLHSSDKFLDLLVWTDPNFKVALEFKLPKGSIIIQPSEGDPE